MMIQLRRLFFLRNEPKSKFKQKVIKVREESKGLRKMEKKLIRERLMTKGNHKTQREMENKMVRKNHKNR